MDPNEHANMILTIIGLSALGLGTLAMGLRAFLRLRRSHPDMLDNFVEDVRRGEGIRLPRAGRGAAPARTQRPENEPPRVLSAGQWFRLVNDYPQEAPHTLIVGSTRKGKTTLAHALNAFRSDRTIVLDPKWSPGKWGGAPTIPIDDDGRYTQLEEAIKQLLGELNGRLVQLKRGSADFEPLTIIADELQTLSDECESAPALFKQVGRLGGELRIRLIAIATSDQVKSLGIAGEGDARDNFITIRLAEHANRRYPALTSLRLARPAVLEWRGEPYALDLETIGELSERRIPVSRHYQLTVPTHSVDNLLSKVLIEPAAHRAPRRAHADIAFLEENGHDHPENFPEAEGSFQVSESNIPISVPDFSAEEIAQIGAAIALGKGKTEILKSMRGYSGRKAKAYSAFYERLRQAIEVDAES